MQKKRFGQHWLINESILNKIRKTAELNSNDFVLEIGPGRGSLTSKLLESKIIGLHAIELDRDLIDFLNRKFIMDKRFTLEQGNILEFNINDIEYDITKVIANIPYNITGPILDIFVGRLGKIKKIRYKKIIFLMQKEVVDRIIAIPGDSNTGALSTRIKLISEVDKICDVHPSSFNPAPKVYSSLVAFRPLPPEKRLNIEIEKFIDKLLKVSFNARRKKIKNTLNSLISSSDIEKIEKSFNINFNLRPQDVPTSTWIKIAKHCININIQGGVKNEKNG